MNTKITRFTQTVNSVGNNHIITVSRIQKISTRVTMNKLWTNNGLRSVIKRLLHTIVQCLSDEKCRLLQNRLKLGPKFRKLQEAMWLTNFEEIYSLSCKAGSVARIPDYFLTMNCNKDKDDKAVYGNKVMIKNYSFGSFFATEIRLFLQNLFDFVYVNVQKFCYAIFEWALRVGVWNTFMILSRKGIIHLVSI